MSVGTVVTAQEVGVVTPVLAMTPVLGLVEVDIGGVVTASGVVG